MCRQHLVWPALILLTMAVYLQVQNFDFVNYDDDTYVTAEHHVLGGLSWMNITWAWGWTFDGGGYHPLTWMSLMLDTELASTLGHWLGISNSGWFHLTNVVIHIASVLILFASLKLMTGAVWKSAIVAALFAVHPLHVESVAWVSERKDMLSTFFGLLSIWGYGHYVKKYCVGWYVMTLVMFVCSLLSKSMLVTLPFLFLLLDFWPLRRILSSNPQTTCSPTVFSDSVPEMDRPEPVPFNRLLLEKTPFFVLTILFSVLSFISQQTWGTITTTEQISLTTRFYNALVVFVAYLRKAVWPSDLMVYYPHPGVEIPTFEILTAGVVLFLTTLFVVFQIRHHLYLFVGWSWYLGTLVPVIGLVQLANSQMADRYTYFPLIGFFVAMVWGISSFVSSSKNDQKVLLVVSSVILIAMTLLGNRQVSYWRNSTALFSHAIRESGIVTNESPITADNPIVQINLGIALEADNRTRQAISRLRKTVNLYPWYTRAHFRLGMLYVSTGNYDSGLMHFQNSIDLDPTYVPAYHSLGVALADQKQFSAAAAYFERALSINPDYAPSHHTLGLIHHIQGKLDSAQDHLLKSLALYPPNARAHYDLGLLYQRQNKQADAMNSFQRALSIQPDFPQAEEALRGMKQL